MVIKKLPKIVLGDREIRILIFLWKWKLVSNAALSSPRFFPSAGPVRAYNRLRQLRQEGLIEVRFDSKLQNFAWALTKKGFAAILEFLPTLKDAGFKSEYFEHDLLVTMFHLGDWLLELPNHVRVFTEQELRRLAFSEYPGWVPKSELHRPDGYFGFVKDDKAIAVAVEIECSRKAPVSYELVGEFYSNLPNLHRVIWLVPNIESAKRIQKTIAGSTSTRSNIHNYVLVSDFQKRGWLALIILGPDAGLDVSRFLGATPRENSEKSTGTFTSQLLLNTRRSFVRSKTSQNFSPGPKRN